MIRSSRGQALVETAVTLALLVVLGLLVVEVGRALLLEHWLTQVTREGARRCVVGTLRGSVRFTDLPDSAVSAMKPLVAAHPLLGAVALSATVDMDRGVVMIHARAARPFNPISRLEPALTLRSETTMAVQ